jgi:hypothetical protein
MSKKKVNFYCPTATVAIIDGLAEDDHRDRTYVLNRIIEFYLEAKGLAAPTARTRKPPTKQKAGAR